MYGELEEVLKYISQKIDETEIARLYRELSTLYEQARNSPSAEITDNIQVKVDEITNSQTKIQPINWDTMKMKAFDKLGASKILGLAGSENFAKELESFSNDPHGVSELCTRYANDIETLRKRITEGLNNFEPLFEDKESLPKGMRRIEVVFDKNVSMDKFSDMATQAKEWDLILKVLKNTVPSSTEDGKFWRIYKSSPTTIIFYVSIDQGFSMLSIIDVVLSIIASLLTIKMYKIQTQQSQLPPESKEKISQIIDEEERKKLEQEIENGVDELVKKSELSGTQRNVAKTSFTYIVKKTYNFFVEGGTINPLDSMRDQKDATKSNNFTLKYKDVVNKIHSKKEQLLLVEFTTQETKKIDEVVDDQKNDKSDPTVTGIKTEAKKYSKSKKINK